ncbi:hypothetical protein PPERSA_05878 [Pseudocohnilembus persalinus]|uniref:Uncharacterized protein n=1 Tax=Pseudocohnilembus persalinus TaxID=266149 RepID=A0A0V0R3Z1_PSEPJ|nr:hypothetical protein PPERSA_05878 [Pseudocohnilembus persalinus]|eukprot:KRX09209.1 hypothetical protein PPERSA_05878 [Pseudocohnilembus persalinus]
MSSEPKQKEVTNTESKKDSILKKEDQVVPVEQQNRQRKKSSSERKTEDTSKHSRSRSGSKKKHKKDKKVKDKKRKSKSRSKEKERDRKKKSKKSSHKKRSRSRSESRKRSKKDKQKSRRSRSRSHRKRRSRRHSSSDSRSPSESTRRKEFIKHYSDQIKNKGRNQQNFKHENAGLIYDGFHWISPDVQSHKILRSVTVFGLPLDKCAFTDQHLQEFLTQFMVTNRLSDSGNQKPIVSCKINQEQKTAQVEFSSFEECNRFAILNKIEILEKECKIVKQHTSNPYNQQQGLEQAVNQGIVQATIMKAMEQIKGDLTEEKKNFYKNQSYSVPGLIKQEAKQEETQKTQEQTQTQGQAQAQNQAQNQSQNQNQNPQQVQTQIQTQTQVKLPALPVIQNNVNSQQQQQQPIKLPPLPGLGQNTGIQGLNLPQILTQSQAFQLEKNLN